MVPVLVIMKPDGTVVTTNGRVDVELQENIAYSKWIEAAKKLGTPKLNE